MKKILMAALALFACVTAASAKTSGIQDVQPKGGFNMGLMVGVPSAGDLDPNTPTISFDGNWTLCSGMWNAGKFGQNGAIDLGFYYGYTNYDYEDNGSDNLHMVNQHTMLVRCAFHFEFVPKLDVYGGMLSGVNLWTPGSDAPDWDPDCKFAMGPFIGCKYFFTDNFGLKAEFMADWADGNVAPANFGLAFKF